MRNVTPKVVLGLIVAVVSFVAIDYVSGGIFRGAPDETNLQVAMFIGRQPLPPDVRTGFRAKFYLRDLDNVRLELSAFDQVMERAKRVALIDNTESIVIRLNFEPKSITIPSTKKELLPSLEKDCRKAVHCLTLDRTLVQESRGHFEIATGLPVTKTSLSSAALKFGVISEQPNTDVEAVVHLPDGWNPTSPMPEPTHVSSFSWTRLTWKGSEDQGISMSAGNDRAIASTLGVRLPIQNAKLRTLETTLLFFLSAIFGAGFTLVAEWLVLASTKSIEKRETASET